MASRTLVTSEVASSQVRPTRTTPTIASAAPPSSCAFPVGAVLSMVKLPVAVDGPFAQSSTALTLKVYGPSPSPSSVGDQVIEKVDPVPCLLATAVDPRLIVTVQAAASLNVPDTLWVPVAAAE